MVRPGQRSGVKRGEASACAADKVAERGRAPKRRLTVCLARGVAANPAACCVIPWETVTADTVTPWLGRYLDPLPISAEGSFRITAARDATSGREQVIVTGAPRANPERTRRALYAA